MLPIIRVLGLKAPADLTNRVFGRALNSKPLKKHEPKLLRLKPPIRGEGGETAALSPEAASRSLGLRG